MYKPWDVNGQVKEKDSSVVNRGFIWVTDRWSDEKAELSKCRVLMEISRCS